MAFTFQTTCHMVMSVVACCSCLCNIPLAIWAYIEYTTKTAPQQPYSTALAMLIVYTAIYIPGFCISLYAAIRISKIANLCCCQPSVEVNIAK